jgi:hypothetical protein
MGDEEQIGVATGRWECDAVDPAVHTVRDDVGAFARRQGMTAPARGDLDVAVAAVVAEAVGRGAGLGVAGRLVVDAACDGAWLSVRVTDSWPADAGAGWALDLALARIVASRLEFGPGVGGMGRSVLMEFAMTTSGLPNAGLRLDAPRRRPCAAAAGASGRCSGGTLARRGETGLRRTVRRRRG